MQGWWGHSANLITQGLCTRVVCTGVVQKGCTQGLHVQGWWGHSANQITQGLHAMVAHAGIAHRGCVHKGGGDTQPISLHRGCAQGLHEQGLCTRVA